MEYSCDEQNTRRNVQIFCKFADIQNISAVFLLLPVVPDVLDIFVVLEHIQHLGHVLDVILVGEGDVAVLGRQYAL